MKRDVFLYHCSGCGEQFLMAKHVYHHTSERAEHCGPCHIVSRLVTAEELHAVAGALLDLLFVLELSADRQAVADGARRIAAQLREKLFRNAEDRKED